MKVIGWLRDIFCWRKTLKTSSTTDAIEKLNKTSDLVTRTIKETSKASKRLLRKLESLEYELDDREALLSEMFKTIPDLLLLKDGEGRWKVINALGKALYGIEGNEYKGLKEAEIFAKFSPIHMSDICLRSDEEAWIARKSIQRESMKRDSLGREHMFDITKTPIFNDDGSRKYLLIHGRDITEELKNTKHISMLAKALNKASDSISITDNEHRIIYANESFLTRYKLNLEDVIGFKMKDIVASGNTSLEVYQDMLSTISKGETWSGTVQNKDSNGELLIEQLTINPILNGKPYPIYYIAVKRAVERRCKTR